jgi:AAA15 family ATPase/GTPase
MLVEFSIKNFRSFRDEQVLSLVASNDNVLEENCATEGKLHLLKAVGIYGPNASGKSNLIKAIKIMKGIVLNSANYKPGKKLPVQPFLLDDESQKDPSSFEVIFYHGDIRYQYGFSATNERIHEEWLLAYPKGRTPDKAQKWFHRSFSKRDTDWKFSSFLKGERERLKDKTRDNALFLSVAAQWNNKQLTTVYEWFKDKLRIVLSKEYLKPITAIMLLDIEKKEDVGKKLYEFVTLALQKADLGIHGFNVKKDKIDRSTIKFFDDTPIEVRKRILDGFEKEPPLKVEMRHFNTLTNEDVILPLEKESDGTQRFFQLLGPWFQAVSNGYTVFIDELEASLHPFLTRELIKFIQDPSNNKTGAQLVFATHDATLLDPDLFRRDQIWFTEKDKSGGTQLYSMSDYKERKPRKGEAMQKGYLAGRYGAIPILEAFSIPNG